MFRHLKDSLISLIGVFTAFLAIKAYISNLLPKLSNESILAVAVVAVFGFYYFALDMYRGARWMRKTKYSTCLAAINDGFSEIHKLIRTKDITRDQIRLACQKLCDKTAKAFTVITSTNCFATIKVYSQKTKVARLKTVTLCRDQHQTKRRKYSDSKKIDHWIDENTDFSKIFNNIGAQEGEYFICNRIPFRSDYRNTSFKSYREPYSSDLPFIGSLIRYLRWPLPYKSTLVVPICPGIAEERIEDNLLGFLCVDSKSQNAFRIDHDVDLLSGIADGLYNIIDQYYK